MIQQDGLDTAATYLYYTTMSDETPQDARQLLEAVRGLVRRFSLSERADLACCGLTVAQSATLEALGDGRALGLGELSRRLGIAPSTLTRNVDRLEAAGLVTRTPEPGDGRALRLRLTKAGERAAREAGGRERAFAESVLARLPSDRRAASLAALQDLLRAVRDATEACCPGAFEHLMPAGDERVCCGKEKR